MPELPEVEAYLDALRPRIVDRTLEAVRVRSPSLLRTVDPPLRDAFGRRVTRLERLGKRLVWWLEGDLALVIHLMVSGRLQERKPGAAVPRKHAHAAFDFPETTLLLTERGKKKRASLHVVSGRHGLRDLDPGGLEVLDAPSAVFASTLRRENRTLKRALTDPRILSGIGNAHSDEILQQAALSPVRRTGDLSDKEIERLRAATVSHLKRFTGRLIEENRGSFPRKVTASHPAMRIHGRFGEACPTCGDPIQRIVYADRETNYCATCQTGGRLLKDRAISRLLGEDWPRSLEAMENETLRRKGG